MNDENPDHSTDSLSPSGLVRIGIGQLFDDRYKILDILGEGGMGIAYKALDTKLERLVALKVLLPYRPKNAKDASRFEREAKMASRLSHPGIAKVFDFTLLNNEQPYLVMEFLDGKTLSQLIETEGQLPVEETIDIFIQISDALAYAHANGILHRDIKPSNIMVIGNSPGLTAKLLDFGIAKPMRTGDITYQTMTETGELVGSPLHMSPEQARNVALDGRSDLYSFGSTLYEALTGGPPHLGHTSIATLLKRETDEPLAMSEASMGRNFPAGLEHLVSKLLKTSPDDRYQSAGEVMQELIRIKSLEPPGFSAEKRDQVSNAVQTNKAEPHRFLRILTYIYAFLGVGVFLSFALNSLLQPNLLRTNLEIKPPAEVSPFPQSDENGSLFFGKYSEKVSTSLGDSLGARGNIPAALSEYRDAASVFERNHQTASTKYADLLTKIACCHQALGNFRDAENYLKQAVNISEKVQGERSEGFAFTLTFTGCKILLEHSKDSTRSFQLAMSFFDRSLSIQSNLPDPYSLRLANLLKMQGMALLSHNFVNEARSRFEEALKILHSAPPGSADKVSMMIALTSLADIYSRAKEYDRIPALCSEALPIYEKCSVVEKRFCADSLCKVADTLRANGHVTKDAIRSYRAAEGAYKAVLVVYMHAPDTPAEKLATVYECLGSTYAREAKHGNRDSFKIAEQWLKQALTFRQGMANPDKLAMARISLKLSNVISGQARYDEAKLLNERALNTYERTTGKDTLEYAEALVYSGEFDRKQNRLAEAEEKFSQALSICQKSGKIDNNVEAGACANLGYCRVDRGLYAEAIAPLQQARKFYLKHTGLNGPNLIVVNHVLGIARANLHQITSRPAPDSTRP